MPECFAGRDSGQEMLFARKNISNKPAADVNILPSIAVILFYKRMDP
jgi:hypothetical protein